VRPGLAARRKTPGECNIRSGAATRMRRMIVRRAELVEGLEAEGTLSQHTHSIGRPERMPQIPAFIMSPHYNGDCPQYPARFSFMAIKDEVQKSSLSGDQTR
jgi:hypothetical protein